MSRTLEHTAKIVIPVGTATMIFNVVPTNHKYEVTDIVLDTTGVAAAGATFLHANAALTAEMVIGLYVYNAVEGRAHHERFNGWVLYAGERLRATPVAGSPAMSMQINYVDVAY